MSRFRPAPDAAIPGLYDPALQLHLDNDGSPLVGRGMLADTLTEVRSEPSDPSEPPQWLFETLTKVRTEDPDDFRALTDTESRTRPDPADPEVGPAVLLPADDSVTGVVAF